MAGLIALWGLSKMVGCGEETPPVEVAPPVEEEPFAGEQAVPCPPEDRWPTGMVCVQGGVLPGCEAEGPGSEPIWVDSVFIDADPVGTGAWEACLGSCACSEQEAPVQSVCEALGKRLSTETEWRAAQLGPLGGLEPGELCAPSEPGRGLDEPGSRCAVSLDGAEGIGTRFVAALEEEHFGADSWYALDPEFRTWRTRQLGIEDVGASYKDPDMAEGLLRAYHAAFPEITRLHELGTSWQGRPIQRDRAAGLTVQ